MIALKKSVSPSGHADNNLGISKETNLSWKSREKGLGTLKLRAVGKNRRNGGFVELSVAEHGKSSSKQTFLTLDPEEAIALRDALNNVEW
jgi:hypothetical protein